MENKTSAINIQVDSNVKKEASDNNLLLFLGW